VTDFAKAAATEGVRYDALARQRREDGSHFADFWDAMSEMWMDVAIALNEGNRHD
jgi:hypothetical protein